MKTLVTVLLMIVALAGRADERKTKCYHGDFVVDTEAAAVRLQYVRCIDGDLWWNLGFDSRGHIDIVHATRLREVRGAVIIQAPYVKRLDFPLLTSAEEIDGSLSGMLGCDEIMRVAYYAGAMMHPICRGGWLP